MSDCSISVASSIVADLARLDPDRLRLAVEYAKAERRRRIRSAVQEVQAALLPGWKNRRAAQAIADAGGLEDLTAWLRSHYKTARLVVIDTLQMIRGQRGKNAGVYEDDYQAVGQLKALADKSGVSFVLVHHLRKESAGDPLESVSGTAGITGSADTILVLKREPKDNFGLLYVRGRDVPENEIAMQFDEATGKWLRLGGADDFRRSEARRAVLRVLIDFGEPVTPAQIADALGKVDAKAKGALRVLLHKMHKAADIVQHAGARYSASQR